MNRRKFIKSVLGLAVAIGFTKTVSAKETGLTASHKRVTNTDELEAGRMYYLKGRGTYLDGGFATCIEYQGIKYFHQRIWADKDNNQAMNRWAIYKTNMIDRSYYDNKGEDDYRREYELFEGRMLGAFSSDRTA